MHCIGCTRSLRSLLYAFPEKGEGLCKSTASTADHYAICRQYTTINTMHAGLRAILVLYVAQTSTDDRINPF